MQEHISFTDESSFHLNRVMADQGCTAELENASDRPCVMQYQSFSGGTVMVWGGITAHGKTPLNW